ncbi:MAG TPA: sterol desaturase family protein [Actinomycetota bacterium]|nr:sterol desaturase family protein [Actinomycetota bacterium]
MSAAEAEQVTTQRESGATTLSQEIRFFASQTNAQLIAGSLALVAVVRLAIGGWRWPDLIIVGAFIALEPFIEWMIHVFILHWKPKQLFGRKVDPLLARKHRAHHRDPRRTDWIFIPFPVLLQVIPISMLLYLLIMPTLRLALTTAVTGLAILLTYEWTHYLIHSRYKPKSRLYKFVWRAHRLHHFKNENYWFGVTMHAGDFVLGTFPAKEDVETSATCKTLGVAEQV